MKRFLVAISVLCSTLATPALARDVDVSINIGHPGFYGQIDLGGFPRPPLIYAQPRIIEYGPVSRPPIYLRVPPGHAKNWRKHCHAYGACGERVYFVRNDWYTNEYVPRYRHRHGHRHDYRDDRRDHRRDHYRDDDRRHDRHERHEHRGDDHDRGGRGRDH
jgi:hypothetical protein